MIVCNKKVLMVLLLGIFLVSCSQNNENIEESVDHSWQEETEETAAVASEPSIEETAVTFDDTSTEETTEASPVTSTEETEETTPETTDEETPLTTFPYLQITHNNSSYVCVEEFEPPALESYFHRPLPDFLTEEQKVLYCCAKTLYPILRGSTIFIDDFPKKDGTPFTPGYSQELYTQWHGVDLRYFVSTGRYAQWDDFVAMGQSVFTDDYFKELSDGTFFEDNGTTCYLDVTRGSPWGYVPEFAPDTFELQSQTETQIDFIVTAYYFDSFHPTKDDIPEEISFPIQLVLTENGWRFSLFAIA